MAKIAVGILGATGAVGQKFILLLADHPWFEIRELAASHRSSGKPYQDAVNWMQPRPMPESVRGMIVKECRPDLDCQIAFSGLDSSVAGEVEETFARAGCWVFSNAKNHRMDPDVPLLITELNGEHLEVVSQQQKNRGWTGAIVTNANCSAIVLALSLGPLHQRFELERVHVVTFQAISGAGYPGVPSMDILSNVVPFISGEEDKIETEPQKILGTLGENGFHPADFTVSSHANRVPVEEGHLECVSLSLKKKASVEEVIRCWEEFRGPEKVQGLPSAPRQPVVVVHEENRPQPRRDVEKYGGMSALVGRVRPCPLLDLKYVVLGHNTIRGAAGASILNAELAVENGLIAR
ncbi:MAG: aspartate-semialdehyde dehydrogenase [Acidobacteriota bacterium]